MYGATIVPASDGSFAWLFFAQPLPGASTITMHVYGSTILAASDGALLDADGDGTAGGELTWTFTTVSLAGLLGNQASPARCLHPVPTSRWARSTTSAQAPTVS